MHTFQIKGSSHYCG